MKPQLVVFLLCLIVCFADTEAKSRTLRRQNASRDLLAQHRPPPNPCRTILLNFADRKDLPQLSLCTGRQMMQGQEDAFKVDTVYRWPSSRSGCSKLSDPLFTMSAGCDTNAIWMFYVLTGHAHPMVKKYCPKNLRQANSNTLVELKGNWEDNVDAAELAMNEHKPRAYIFDEKGITHPYHYWIVLQTPNKDATASNFEVFSGFANSWRVIDWFRQNKNIPLPSYAGRTMMQAEFKRTFWEPLKQMFAEVTTNKEMTEKAQALYRDLWAVDGWGSIGKPILGIQYAPATQSTCQQYARAFTNVQGLSSARKWKGAAQATNIVSKSEAMTRASKCKENSLCLGQYDNDNCQDDLDRL